MGFLDILLIVISSTGLLHGAMYAVYIYFFNTKRTLSNLLLGLILVVMAFRIGKSVMLNFGSNLEPIFIFAGLALLLAIGPLLRWYVLAMTKPNFKIPNNYLVELIPYLIIFILSFFINKTWFDKKNKEAIIVFSGIIIFIYLHLAFYIFIAGRLVWKVKKKLAEVHQTKSQNAVLRWLYLLIIGLILIWFTYVLNIIEDTIPYIVGPIVYSIVIYYLSYMAFKLKSTIVDGNIFAENANTLLFRKITELMVDQRIYLEADVSLVSLSKFIDKSPQKTSEVINQYAKQNFNDYINYYRIQDAKSMLLDASKKEFTVASVAFDIGFSSLSSFNAAFKKFTGTTPTMFKKNYITS